MRTAQTTNELSLKEQRLRGAERAQIVPYMSWKNRGWGGSEPERHVVVQYRDLWEGPEGEKPQSG